MTLAICTLQELYAHALAMEREAAHRYAEFEEWFRDRDEPVLAGLCATLARAERRHLEQLREASARLDVPSIDAAGYRWLETGSPEPGARELFYRVAQPHHLLEIALQAETRALLFYEWVARTAAEPAVRSLAHEMAAEERLHVAWVRDALDYHPSADSHPV